jgi:serine kinase of HPr protein (carbohydrate metabolism regulator)
MEVAANNFRLKKMGYNAALELTRRVQEAEDEDL